MLNVLKPIKTFPIRSTAVRAVFAFLVLLGASTLAAQDLRLLPISRVGSIGPSIVRSGISTADVNGDGVGDMTTCNSSGSPFIVTRTGSTFAPYWMGPPVNCAAVTVGDVDHDGSLDVIVVTNASPAKLIVFNPRSFAPIAKTTMPDNGAGAGVAFGNVDSDSAPEIIVTTAAATYMYDAATLQLKWNAAGFNGKSVAIGDVNGDGRKDIVVNGGTGYVLDGQLHNVIFGYLGGFGNSMAVGDIDNDGKAEIVFVASYANQATIIEGDTQTTRTIPATAGYAVDAVGLGDINGDGIPEVLTGNNQWGAVEARRPSDGLLLWTVNSPGWGCNGIIGGDVTGDAQAEVIWSSASNSYYDGLYVADVPSHTIAWTGPASYPPGGVAIGDIDNDGRLEQVVAVQNNQVVPGTVQIFDFLTGAYEATLPMPQGTSNAATNVAIGQLDNDAAKEIVAVVDNRLVTWDGITRQIEFTGANVPCCSTSIVASSMFVANLDGGALDKIVLGQSDSKILIFNGATNFAQQILPVSGSVTEFAAADLNGDGRPELVAGTSSTLYVFDTLSWTSLGSAAAPASHVAAARDGSVAITSSYPSNTVSNFSGVTLTPGWTCSITPTYGGSAVALLAVGGQTRVIVAMTDGTLRSYPASGNTCVTPTSTEVFATQISGLSAVDVTGDNRPELLIRGSVIETDLVGASTEINGDVNGDTLVNATDVDMVTDWFLIGPPGISPAGDVNRDQHIGPDDVLTLINYQYSGGSLPQ